MRLPPAARRTPLVLGGVAFACVVAACLLAVRQSALQGQATPEVQCATADPRRDDVPCLSDYQVSLDCAQPFSCMPGPVDCTVRVKNASTNPDCNLGYRLRLTLSGSLRGRQPPPARQAVLLDGDRPIRPDGVTGDNYPLQPAPSMILWNNPAAAGPSAPSAIPPGTTVSGTLRLMRGWAGAVVSLSFCGETASTCRCQPRIVRALGPLSCEPQANLTATCPSDPLRYSLAYRLAGGGSGYVRGRADPACVASFRDLDPRRCSMAGGGFTCGPYAAPASGATFAFGTDVTAGCSAVRNRLEVTFTGIDDRSTVPGGYIWFPSNDVLTGPDGCMVEAAVSSRGASSTRVSSRVSSRSPILSSLAVVSSIRSSRRAFSSVAPLPRAVSWIAAPRVSSAALVRPRARSSVQPRPPAVSSTQPPVPVSSASYAAISSEAPPEPVAVTSSAQASSRRIAVSCTGRECEGPGGAFCTAIGKRCVTLESMPCRRCEDIVSLGTLPRSSAAPTPPVTVSSTAAPVRPPASPPAPIRVPVTPVTPSAHRFVIDMPVDPLHVVRTVDPVALGANILNERSGPPVTGLEGALTRAPAGRTGPAAVLIMTGGAAAGWAWIRRKRRS